MLELTQEEKVRFRRQIMIFGEDGQRKLKEASAFVTRVGGLGGPVAIYLALAGIGKLVVAHGGVVEPSNMNRQLLMSYEAIGKPRINCIRERLHSLNPFMNLVTYGEDIAMDEERTKEIVSQVDIAVACPPTFEERFNLNKACVELGKPLIEVAMYGMEGYITFIKPGVTPCLACLFPSPPRWSIPFPVLGSVSALMGCIAATEVIKYITGYGNILEGWMLHIDTRDWTMRKVRVNRRKNCPVCGVLEGR